jgi:hypothetical protein
MSAWKPFACLVLVCISSSASSAAQESRGRTAAAPRAFGVDDYTVTTISATGFVPGTSDTAYTTSGSWGRAYAVNTVTEFFASPDIPAGAVIDYIGLNSFTDTPGALTAELRVRNSMGVLSSPLISVASAAFNDWRTDYNSPGANVEWTAAAGLALIVRVVSASLPTPQVFGWVEIWWHRTVSVHSGAPTFNDVPVDHPFYQYIEALADSGITGGCGNGNFCPGEPVTRGQMAVFLAKALGLNFPGALLPPGSTHN